MEVDLVINGAHVVTEYGVTRCGVAVDQGRIVALGDEKCLPRSTQTINAEGLHLLPGGVDPHVHFRDPSEPVRETFRTGTMAAAAGGVTTVCEQPVSLPPQYSPEILTRRQDVARSQALVDYAFFGAAGADKLEEIPRMGREGIVAFKTFFHSAPEGREREFTGLTMENDAKILEGFRAVAETGKILAVHAENNDIINTNIKRLRAEGKTQPEYHERSRSPICEIEAVAKVLLLAREVGLRVEICHVSTAGACELVKQAKSKGQEVYLETCPQYLFLTLDDLRKHGAYAKCNPPVREASEVQALWDYVRDGTVDFVGSDHSPYLSHEKERNAGDIFAAPAGMPGVDLRLSLMLTGVSQGRLNLDRAVYLLSKGPAVTYGLYPRKGAIRVGADADFVLVDLDKKFVVRRQDSYSMAKDIARVYDGWQLTGEPKMTIVRGRVIMENGLVDERAAGWGSLITPRTSKEA